MGEGGSILTEHRTKFESSIAIPSKSHFDFLQNVSAGDLRSVVWRSECDLHISVLVSWRALKTCGFCFGCWQLCATFVLCYYHYIILFFHVLWTAQNHWVQQIVSCVRFTQPVLMACFLQLTFQTREKFLTFCFQLLKIKHFFDPGMMSLLCNSLVCLILSCGLFRGCYFNGFKCYSVTVFYEFVFHRVNGFGKHNRKWHVCAGVCEKEREKEGGREKKNSSGLSMGAQSYRYLQNRKIKWKQQTFWKE